MQQSENVRPCPPVGIDSPYFTDDEVIARFRLDVGRNRKSASMALLRAWREAQAIRHDMRLTALQRIKIGRSYRYSREVVEALEAALLVTT